MWFYLDFGVLVCYVVVWLVFLVFVGVGRMVIVVVGDGGCFLCDIIRVGYGIVFFCVVVLCIVVGCGVLDGMGDVGWIVVVIDVLFVMVLMNCVVE